MRKPRLSIRTRLVAWMSLAGLIPLVAMAAFGLLSITGRLRSAIEKETRRSLRIGMNLVLRKVQQVATDVTRLGHAPNIQAVFRKYKALALRPGPRPKDIVDVGKVMERYRGEVSSGLVELCDIKGKVFARYSLGSSELEKSLSTQDNAPIIQKGLDFEHHVNFVRGKKHVVLRAIAPVVNSRYELLGAVILSLPMDHHMAESLRATLRVDVAFYIGTDDGTFLPAASSMVAVDGDRYEGFKLDRAVYEEAKRKRSTITVAKAMNRSFSVGLIPLLNSDKKQSKNPEMGLLAVAVDRQALVQSRDDAINAMVILAGLGIAVALVLAFVAARSLSTPLRKLHSGAMAVARGDLELEIDVPSGDEIGELAEAFNYMTGSLRENQKRLAARISEIITLHTIGRAVSSVMGLDEVLRTVVDEIRQALGTDICALFLADDDDRLWLNASAGLTDDEVDEWEKEGESPLAKAALDRDEPLTIDDVEETEQYIGKVAQDHGLSGSLMAVPLEQKERRVGVMVILRKPPASPFGEGELRLLSTLADQAGTAIESARLYEEVTAFNERLEAMVEERTTELREANEELATTLQDLQETQAQLVLSERLAGLGSLVAGIAHEVNTPAAAIQGAVTNLTRNIQKVAETATHCTDSSLDREGWTQFIALVHQEITSKRPREILPSAESRRRAKALEAELKGYGFRSAPRYARRMMDLGASDALVDVVKIGGPENAEMLAAVLMQLVLLKRNTGAVETAIKTINRIVTALRAYSHLDQTRVDRVNIHDGIETTLIILNNRLKYDVTLTRRYGELPPVPVFVDELNQVWTNLIVNAADAVNQRTEGDKEVIIETEAQGEEVVVRIIDNGPGIPDDVLPRIFKPFFTTKPQGQGTGLGLGIVQRIVAKHGGRIDADSKPGATSFSVFLPIAGPPKISKDDDAHRGSATPGNDQGDSKKPRNGGRGEGTNRPPSGSFEPSQSKEA